MAARCPNDKPTQLVRPRINSALNAKFIEELQNQPSIPPERVASIKELYEDMAEVYRDNDDVVDGDDINQIDSTPVSTNSNNIDLRDLDPPLLSFRFTVPDEVTDNEWSDNDDEETPAPIQPNTPVPWGQGLPPSHWGFNINDRRWEISEDSDEDVVVIN